MTRAGLTVLELLLVCAVLGVLLSVSAVGFRAAQNRARLGEATAQFAADVQRARSSAQRFNQAATLALPSATATSYTLTLDGQTRTRALPAGTQVAAAQSARAVTYTAPFGETEVSNLSFRVERVGGQGESRTVRVLGVTGKVYTQ